MDEPINELIMVVLMLQKALGRKKTKIVKLERKYGYGQSGFSVLAGNNWEVMFFDDRHKLNLGTYDLTTPVPTRIT